MFRHQLKHVPGMPSRICIFSIRQEFVQKI